MNKIAVFGKPGSGKSTLSKALASATGIPLHPLDSILYQQNGIPVNRETFNAAHESILSADRWIIDGFGPIDSFHRRLEAANTLIYIDLPYFTSYWFVTKRLLKGIVVKPEGWPDGSSVLKGTLESYSVLKLCPKFWNNDFKRRLHMMSKGKSVHLIESVAELNRFVHSKVNLQASD